MADDLATLGIKIDDTQVVSATGNLDKLTKAGASAEAQTQKLAGANTTASKVTAEFNKNTHDYINIVSDAEKHTHNMVLHLGEFEIGAGRATREVVSLVRELLEGNWTGFASSIATTTAHSNLLALAFSGVGLTVIAVGVGIAALTASFLTFNAQQRDLINTTQGLGAASGLTASQIQDAANKASLASSSWSGASLKAAESFAAAGVSNAATLTSLTANVQSYADLTGQKFADAQKTLAEAMQDPVKGAQTLDDQLHLLNATQLDQIDTYIALGDKASAQAVITDALAEKTAKADAAATNFDKSVKFLSTSFQILTAAILAANGQLTQFDALVNAGQSKTVTGKDIAGALDPNSAANIAKQNAAQEAARAVTALTPEGQNIANINKLLKEQSDLKVGLAAFADIDKNSAAYLREQASLDEVNAALKNYHGEASKAHDIAQANIALAEANKAHDKDAIYRAAYALEEAKAQGTLVSAQELATRAQDAATLAMDRSHTAHQKHVADYATLENELDKYNGKLAAQNELVGKVGPSLEATKVSNAAILEIEQKRTDAAGHRIQLSQQEMDIMYQSAYAAEQLKENNAAGIQVWDELNKSALDYQHTMAGIAIEETGVGGKPNITPQQASIARAATVEVRDRADDPTLQYKESIDALNKSLEVETKYQAVELQLQNAINSAKTDIKNPLATDPAVQQAMEKLLRTQLDLNNAIQAQAGIYQGSYKKALEDQKVYIAALDTELRKHEITLAEYNKLLAASNQNILHLKASSSDLFGDYFKANMADALGGVKSMNEELANMASNTVVALSQGFGTAITGIIDGTQSATQAFEQLAETIVTTVINAIIQLIIKETILKALGLALGLAGGGSVSNLSSFGGEGGFTSNDVGISSLSSFGASGTYISGPGGPKDDVIPIWVSNGEYVINAASTAKYRNEIEAINRGTFAVGGAANDVYGTVYNTIKPANDVYSVAYNTLNKDEKHFADGGSVGDTSYVVPDVSNDNRKAFTDSTVHNALVGTRLATTVKQEITTGKIAQEANIQARRFATGGMIGSNVSTSPSTINRFASGGSVSNSSSSQSSSSSLTFDFRGANFGGVDADIVEKRFRKVMAEEYTPGIVKTSVQQSMIANQQYSKRQPLNLRRGSNV